MAERRVRSASLLLLIPLLIAAIVCASQLGLFQLRPDRLETAIEPHTTADYSKWPWLRFNPVNPALGTLVAQENSVSPQSNVIVGLLPTDTATPTPPLIPTPTASAALPPPATPPPAAASTTPAVSPQSTPTETLIPLAANPTQTPTETVTSSLTPTLSATPTPTLLPSIAPTSVAQPTALFAMSVNGAFSVQFTNQSTGSITSYLWDFGDGRIDQSIHPLHIYPGAGVYTIILIVSGPGGASSRSATITLQPLPPSPAPTWTLLPFRTPTSSPTPSATATPTLTATPSATPSPTFTLDPSITPSLTFTPSSTFTPTETLTPSPTGTSTPTLTPTTAPNCPAAGEPDVGAPDGLLCQVAGGQNLVVDLGCVMALGGGYDLVYYEEPRFGNTQILLDHVIISVSEFPGGPWTQVFNWGDNLVDTNTSVGQAGYGASGEPNDLPIPMTNPPLYGPPPLISGVAIDVTTPGNYRWARLDVPVSGSPLIDALEVLACSAATPTPTNTPTPSLNLMAMCSPDPNSVRVWRVQSTYLTDVVFDWQIAGSPQSGSLTAPAMVGGVPGQVLYTSATEPGANTMIISVGGVQVDVSASNPAQCPAEATATALYLTSQPTVTATPTATATNTPSPTPTDTPTTGAADDVSLAASCSTTTPTPGETFTCSLMVSQPGSTSWLSPTLALVIDSGLNLTGSSMSGSPGAPGSYTLSLVNGSGTWQIVGMLSGQWVQLNLTLQVDAAVPPGTVLNLTAAISNPPAGDPNPVNNAAIVPITVTPP